jgi:hypothetical protein
MHEDDRREDSEKKMILLDLILTFCSVSALATMGRTIDVVFLAKGEKPCVPRKQAAIVMAEK